MSRFEMVFTLFLSLFMGALLVPERCFSQARVPTALPSRHLIEATGQSLPVELTAAYEKAKTLGQSETTKYAPPELKVDTDSRVALRKIADKTFQTWWNSAEVQSSPMARSVEKVEDTMNQEIVLSDEAEIEHKLNFQFLPFQSLAKMDYSGFINATVFYAASSAKTGIEISEKIFSQNIVLGHEISSEDSLSRLSLHWSW